MSFYKVRVDCWKQDKKRPTRVIRWFIVEALEIRAVEEPARDFAELSAEFGRGWIKFEVREAHAISFPLEIKP